MDADPSNTPCRVGRTLHEANQFLGNAFTPLASHSPYWGRDVSATAPRIKLRSVAWSLALAELAKSNAIPTATRIAHTPTPAAAAPRRNTTDRPGGIPEHIRRLIPRNAEGTEPCLKFFGGDMCDGGTRETCAATGRTHVWPTVLPAAPTAFTSKRFGSRSREDYRSNKAPPSVLAQQWRGYERRDSLLQIAAEGVRVRLIRPLPHQALLPRNHPSVSTRLNGLRANIHKEQDLFLCLVVDADITAIWPKSSQARSGLSANMTPTHARSGEYYMTCQTPKTPPSTPTPKQQPPPVTFEHCSSVSPEILRCHRDNTSNDVVVMDGDVASAYRNTCIHNSGSRRSAWIKTGSNMVRKPCNDCEEKTPDEELMRLRRGDG
ncbi:hypothetical protein PF005_g5195 [Phytophthora fragariae]|uniref:Uncharacterized protein n=1 Tax=Phytophthora fragariae TaxID=53985 RepID=A0A6A3YYI8_9STRA|nr:hypothetical protein PF005_g5195 [Phytophthora fragariae]